jgi:hypothetical protein
MRKIIILFICVLIFTFNACSPKFQTQYKITDKAECKEFFDFLNKEFYRDKKGNLRTIKDCFWLPELQKSSFDTAIVKHFFDLVQKEKKLLYCNNTLKVSDFYATLGKPDFVGVNKVYNFHYCVYLISDSQEIYCPCGTVHKDGSFRYKSKMGYWVAPYCHILEVRFRPKDDSIFAIELR